MCCTAKCCPLVTAWATTIHKFQGFEAGFDETDMFRRLIINPGSEKWEKDCPGAFYVSLSRAKTMGSRTSDTDFPKDSAIYWIGEGVNINRIRQGAYIKRKKRSDPIRQCDAVIKRERWVQYLQRRKDLTTKRIYSKSELRDIKKKRFPPTGTRRTHFQYGNQTKRNLEGTQDWKILDAKNVLWSVHLIFPHATSLHPPL